MNKTFFILAVCFLLAIKTAHSSTVDVGVSEVLEGNMISMDVDSSSNLVKFSSEFYNMGSVPYKARIKTEIYNNTHLIFGGWNDEKDFMPGDKKMFDSYWYANAAGDYFVKIKVYFGNDIKEYKKVGFSVENIADSEDIFGIKNFRTYDNYVLFDLESSEDANNIVIIPFQYKAGWIFEQKVIENMAKDSSKYIMLNYYPSLWSPSTVKLAIASDNGKYYSEKTLEMNKITGLTGLFYYITDTIKYALFK